MEHDPELVGLLAAIEVLGYLWHSVDFEHAIKPKELRERLASDFPEAELTRLLTRLPDFFVLHPKLSDGAFFVKIVLSDKSPLDDATLSIYRKYFRSSILLVRLVRSNAGTTARCRWLNEKAQTSLSAALSQRFGAHAGKNTLDNIAAAGFAV